VKARIVKAALISAGLHTLLLIPVSDPADLTQADVIRGISSVELELVPLQLPNPELQPEAEPEPELKESFEAVKKKVLKEVKREKPVPVVLPAVDQGVSRPAVALELQNQPPKYPWRARLKGWEGTVIVRTWVSAQGKAVSVHIERSSGYPTLDEAAAGSVLNWKFRPAQRQGRVISQAVEVPITFRLQDRHGRPKNTETYGGNE